MLSIELNKKYQFNDRGQKSPVFLCIKTGLKWVGKVVELGNCDSQSAGPIGSKHIIPNPNSNTEEWSKKWSEIK